MSLPQMRGGQNSTIRTVRRYFTGSTVLRKGQVLHYVENADDPNTTDGKQSLGHAVEVITADNIDFFAGVVPEHEAGKQGPCFVELLAPQYGDILDVEVDGTTDVAVDALLTPDATEQALVAGGARGIARALVARTADTAAAIKVYFTGEVTVDS